MFAWSEDFERHSHLNVVQLYERVPQVPVSTVQAFAGHVGGSPGMASPTVTVTQPAPLDSVQFFPFSVPVHRSKFARTCFRHFKNPGFTSAQTLAWSSPQLPMLFRQVTEAHFLCGHAPPTELCNSEFWRKRESANTFACDRYNAPPIPATNPTKQPIVPGRNTRFIEDPFSHARWREYLPPYSQPLSVQ